MGGAMIKDLELPATVLEGEPLMLHLGAELVDRVPRWYQELGFFVHLTNESGGVSFAGGVPLVEALLAARWGVPVNCGILKDAAPGEYRVRLGVWNARTRKRLSVEGDALSPQEMGERSVDVGSIRVVPAASTDR
jgi:hypothetical protein